MTPEQAIDRFKPDQLKIVAGLPIRFGTNHAPRYLIAKMVRLKMAYCYSIRYRGLSYWTWTPLGHLAQDILNDGNGK